MKAKDKADGVINTLEKRKAAEEEIDEGKKEKD